MRVKPHQTNSKKQTSAFAPRWRRRPSKSITSTCDGSSTGHCDYKAMRPYIDIAEKAKAEQMAIFENGLKG